MLLAAANIFGVHAGVAGSLTAALAKRAVLRAFVRRGVLEPEDADGMLA